MNELVAGQNAPVAASRLVFSVATGEVEPDLIGLVVGADLRATGPDDVVFYNQSRTAGVHLDGRRLVVDLHVLRAGATVLCAVSLDDAVGDLSAGLTAELGDESGAELFTFTVKPIFGETALLCFELYQRAARWKVRALGQGYRGGLAELLTAHGVDVDDAPDLPSSTPVPDPRTVVGAAPAAVGLGTGYGAAVARAHVVFEDAARSAAGFVQAESFALDRLDQELGDALADPADRNSPAAAQARAAAQQRCDDLVAAARARFAADSAILMAELAALDPQLPPAMASWASPAWKRTHVPSAGGLRLGELSAPERGELRLPFCVPTPIARPIWVLDAGSPVLPVVASLTLRLMVAARVSFAEVAVGKVHVDVFDVTGSISPLIALLQPVLTTPAVTSPDAVTERLSVLESAVDLTQMAVQAGEVDGLDTRVVVISEPPFGWDPAGLARLLRIVDRGSELGWAFVFAGLVDEHDGDPLVNLIADRTMMLPVTDEARAQDPWVGLPWTVIAEQIDPGSTLALQIVSAMNSDQPRSNADPHS